MIQLNVTLSEEHLFRKSALEKTNLWFAAIADIRQTNESWGHNQETQREPRHPIKCLELV